MQQIGGRRLPARAGDADDRQRLGRPAPELVGDGRERGASIRHEDLRRGEVESPFHDERDRAVRDGLCGPVVSVDAEAADAEEDAAGAHAPRVDDQILDHAASVADDRARVERGEHVAQLHRGSSLTAAARRRELDATNVGIASSSAVDPGAMSRRDPKRCR